MCERETHTQTTLQPERQREHHYATSTRRKDRERPIERDRERIVASELGSVFESVCVCDRKRHTAETEKG